MSEGISFDEAMRALRKWYYTEVREWAADYDKRIAAKEWEDSEAFQEDFDESTDSAGIIIHTAQAKAVCLASDNEDAYFEAFGDEPSTVTSWRP